jgi:transcription initiation factor IIE alpha subunit
MDKESLDVLKKIRQMNSEKEYVCSVCKEKKTYKGSNGKPYICPECNKERMRKRGY